MQAETQAIEAPIEDQEADPGLPPQTDRGEADAVAEWINRIASSRSGSHEKAFKKMEKARFQTTHGRQKDWGGQTVNVTGPHVQGQAAALYARNPTCVVRPAVMMDFAIWDESPQSLQMAQETIQIAMQAPGDPMIMQAAMEAQELLEDHREGTMRRMLRAKLAKTVQIAVQKTWDLQFKMDLKNAVKGSLACGVTYVRPDHFRTTSRDPRVLARINDTRTQIAEIESSMGMIEGDSVGEPAEEVRAQMTELQQTVDALEAQAEVIEREGILYSFPASDRLIFDPDCRSITTFAGANWIAEEIPGMTRKKILASYGIDIKVADKSGVPGGKQDGRVDGRIMPVSGTGEPGAEGKDDEVYPVYEVYDRRRRLKFAVTPAYQGYLEKPAEPATFTKRFWPWVPIAFNGQELPEGEIFPPSDAMLLEHLQDEINNAAQGLAEHRKASRPMFVAMDNVTDQELTSSTSLPAFSIIRLAALGRGGRVDDLIQPFPRAPIDPALYDKNGLMRDIEAVVGSAPAQLGAVSGATATENAIAAESRDTENVEKKDGLDDALAVLAEMVAHMMLDSFHAETIQRMVGPGAVWPELSRRDIVDWLEIGIRAGSSGRPNKAMDVANMERITPVLLNVPGIDPTWLAREMIRILEADVSLDEGLSAGMPSITTMNAIDKANATGGQAGPSEMQGDVDPDGEEPGAQPAFDSSGNLP